MIWKYVWAYVLGVVFLYLQLLVMPVFELASVIPNILVPWLIYMVWTREQKVALVACFLIGLMYDATQPNSFGLHALSFVLMCLVLDFFRKPFEAASKLAKILTLIIANLMFYFMQWLILGVIYGFTAKLAVMNLIALIYNLAISFVVFWVMQFVSRLRVVMVHE
jgi:rod shape-determining protein MreD